MSEQLARSLCLASGVIAISVGLMLTRNRLRRARRVHRKSGLIHATMPEGWGFWFFQGFSDVTVGTGLVVSAVVLAFWMVVGVALVCLGLRLAWHP